jgi:hypothetical protein
LEVITLNEAFIENFSVYLVVAAKGILKQSFSLMSGKSSIPNGTLYSSWALCDCVTSGRGRCVAESGQSFIRF